MRLAAFGGDFAKSLDLRRAEQQPAGRRTLFGPLGFQLSGQHAALIAVAEHVGDDGLDVLCLRAALGKGAAADHPASLARR